MSLRDHIILAIRNDARSVGTSLSRLSYIRVYPRSFNVKEMIVEGPIGDCAICQEDFKIGEVFVPLACNDIHPHKFHKQCITPWLKSHNTCPTCRGSIN